MRVESESSPSKEKKKLLDRELIGESEKGEKRFFGRLIGIVSGTNGDVFAEVSAVPGILEVALAQKGALVRIFRHAISLFTVISTASRYLALLKQ